MKKPELKVGYICQWNTIIGSKEVRVVECGDAWGRQALVVDEFEKMGVAAVEDLVVTREAEPPQRQFSTKPVQRIVTIMTPFSGDETIGRYKHV